MLVHYMFQTQDDTIGNEDRIAGESTFELRGRCQDELRLIEWSQSGHGAGVGEWAHLGESFDWTMTFEMSERDFGSLQDEYGLSPATEV